MEKLEKLHMETDNWCQLKQNQLLLAKANAQETQKSDEKASYQVMAESKLRELEGQLRKIDDPDGVFLEKDFSDQFMEKLVMLQARVNNHGTNY